MTFAESIVDQTGAVYLENLLDGQSVFRHQTFVFRWAPYGYDGSVIEVPKAIAETPFLAQKIKRGLIRHLSATEASERLEELVPYEMHQHAADLLEKATAVDADKTLTNPYSNPNLRDDADIVSRTSAEEISQSIRDRAHGPKRDFKREMKEAVHSPKRAPKKPQPEKTEKLSTVITRHEGAVSVRPKPPIEAKLDIMQEDEVL